MSTEPEAPGRRDRKKAETRARIEAAAVELVFADGLDATTIDAISERADIAPRTFFNHFDSKDAAVLGVRPPEADEAVMNEQLAASGELDPIEALVQLVMTAMSIAESVESGLYRRRLEIIRRHPDIVAGLFAQLSARKDRLASHAVEILVRNGAVVATDPDAAAHADMALALCNSAVHSAVLEWVQAPAESDQDLGALAVEHIERRAVALVRAAVRLFASSPSRGPITSSIN